MSAATTPPRATDAGNIPQPPEAILEAFGQRIAPPVVDAAAELYRQGWAAGFLAGLDAAEAVVSRLGRSGVRP